MVYSKEEIDKLDEMEKVLLMFKTRHRENLSMLTEGDADFMKFEQLYEDMTNDKKLIDEYTKEELEIMAFWEKIGKELAEELAEEKKQEGINSRNIEIAKNMLKDKVDINTISKYTNLSKKEIEKLK